MLDALPGPHRSGSRNPLPDGCRFWIWPEYRLQTPTICVLLPRTPGVVLAILLAHRGARVPTDAIRRSLYGDKEYRWPLTSARTIAVHVSWLKTYLRQYGIHLAMDRYISGHYVLRDIGACEPRPGKYRERLTPRNGGHPLRSAAAIRWAITIPSKSHRSKGIRDVASRANPTPQPYVDPRASPQPVLEAPWVFPNFRECRERAIADRQGPDPP